MKAVTWHGKRDVRVDNVPDPVIEQPNDAIIKVTLERVVWLGPALYEVMMPYMNAGDILGHEPMGIVEEVGPEVTNLAVGDRVVMPFQIACGSCFMCDSDLQTQCETTQVTAKRAWVRHCSATPTVRQRSRRPGRVPAGAAGAVRSDRRSRWSVGRPVPLPVRRPPDRMAGVEYADVAPRRHPGRARARADRRDGVPDRPHRGCRDVIGVDLVPDRLAAHRPRRRDDRPPRA